MKYLFLLPLFVLSFGLTAQSLPCEVEGSEKLAFMIGEWKVSATDRNAPGAYEENKGTATITWGIAGCSIHELYEGTFKSHLYAVEYVTYLSDSLTTQRTFFDSEHANMMSFDGVIEGKSIINHWYRDPEKKRMQVKNELRILNKDSFENITHLSTDYGKTWALTHKWVYTR